jgi:SAM-dependent methyltransferase
MTPPKPAQDLAQKHLAAGDPLGWFEVLYSTAANEPAKIPWADLQPNPHLLTWLNTHELPPGKRALKIGSGLGDDAEELARRGMNVTAFDISSTAIAWSRRRFRHSPCEYFPADVLNPPPQWNDSFDFVFEAYTLQVLPPPLRRQAMRNIALFLVPTGTLLIVCRGREPTDPEGQMPWPLTRRELDTFTVEGKLIEQTFEDFLDDESPPVRRFRVLYAKPPI